MIKKSSGLNKDYKVIIRDIIIKQELKEHEKIIYIKILEEFFLIKVENENLLDDPSLTEDEFLIELTLKFLDFAQKNIDLYSKSLSSELSSNKTESIFLNQFNSKSLISSYSSVYNIKKNSEKITIDKFDQIKTNIKYLTETSIFENDNRKVISLDKLLEGIYCKKIL